MGTPLVDPRGNQPIRMTTSGLDLRISLLSWSVNSRNAAGSTSQFTFRPYLLVTLDSRLSSVNAHGGSGPMVTTSSWMERRASTRWAGVPDQTLTSSGAAVRVQIAILTMWSDANCLEYGLHPVELAG